MFYALTILSLFFIYDYLTGISSTQHPNKQQHIPHSFSIKISRWLILFFINFFPPDDLVGDISDEKENTTQETTKCKENDSLARRKHLDKNEIRLRYFAYKSFTFMTGYTQKPVM